MNILTSITAIVGAVLGGASLTLGILNYLRDRSRVKVRPQWNMVVSDRSLAEDERECGLITVTNVGRRPVYVSHACLILPRAYENRLLLLVDSIQGRRLSEGEPPQNFIVRHDIQERYSKDLKRIRVQVSDSTGQVYLSKRPDTWIPSRAKKSKDRT